MVKVKLGLSSIVLCSPFLRLPVDNPFELLFPDTVGRVGPLLPLFLGLLMEHFRLVLQRGEDQAYHRASGLGRSQRIEPVVHWPDVRLRTLELRLHVLLWDAVPELETFCEFFG